jgi:hypothetical protein
MRGSFSDAFLWLPCFYLVMFQEAGHFVLAHFQAINGHLDGLCGDLLGQVKPKGKVEILM